LAKFYKKIDKYSEETENFSDNESYVISLGSTETDEIEKVIEEEQEKLGKQFVDYIPVFINFLI